MYMGNSMLKLLELDALGIKHYGMPFEHLFNILDIGLKVHVLVSFLSSLIRQFGTLVELLECTSRTTVSY